MILYSNALLLPFKFKHAVTCCLLSFSPLPNHPDTSATTLRRSCREALETGKGGRQSRPKAVLSSRKQVCTWSHISSAHSFVSATYCFHYQVIALVVFLAMYVIFSQPRPWFLPYRVLMMLLLSIASEKCPLFCSLFLLLWGPESNCGCNVIFSSG